MNRDELIEMVFINSNMSLISDFGVKEMVCDRRDLITKDPCYTWYDNKPIPDIPDDLISKTKLQEIKEEKQRRSYNKFKRKGKK